MASLILGLGGLGMMGAGAYIGATRKGAAKKKPLPWLLIAFGLVSLICSFVVLMIGRPAPPAPRVVQNVPKIIQTINNPNNMGRLGFMPRGPGGRPSVVINPA